MDALWAVFLAAAVSGAGTPAALREQAAQALTDGRVADAAERMASLADVETLPAGLRDDLRRAAAALREEAQAPPSAFSPAAYREILDRVQASLTAAAPLGLDFQGSYAQTKVTEPA